MRQTLQRALALSVLPYRRDRLLVQQVREVLRAHPGGTHNAEGVAAWLHIPARTLHRQLKPEGATLQNLKDDVRFERARDLLLRTQAPLRQVAAAVGFRNEESFARVAGVGRITRPASCGLECAHADPGFRGCLRLVAAVTF